MGKRKKEEHRTKQAGIHKHKIAKMDKKCKELNKRYPLSEYKVEELEIDGKYLIARIRRIKGRRPHKIKRVK